MQLNRSVTCLISPVWDYRSHISLNSSVSGRTSDGRQEQRELVVFHRAEKIHKRCCSTSVR